MIADLWSKIIVIQIFDEWWLMMITDYLVVDNGSKNFDGDLLMVLMGSCWIIIDNDQNAGAIEYVFGVFCSQLLVLPATALLLTKFLLNFV